ncbi:MAG TPA: hypothetical protein VL328_10690 [Gemmatimonadaceae bacterium]|jgi:hypothetical protein|nr:hypothetical protein [Gemmatimonadaceae bacterium]
MLRVFGEGDDVFRLEDGAGTRIGTIRGRAIGFRGFATESDARDAAVAAWHAMNGALRREYSSWPHHTLAVDLLRTTHDGAYEWFYDGTRAIARLLRPGRDDDGGHGIELLLPSYSSEAVAISAAHAIARAVAPYRDELTAEASSATPAHATSEEDAAATAA